MNGIKKKSDLIQIKFILEIYGDELAWVIIYMDNERLIRNSDGVLQPGTIFKMRKKLDPCS